MTGIDLSSIHRALAVRRATLAVAESLTAGLLCAALTDTPGSSATFRGGLVVYATDLKHSLAGVPADLLQEHGPVSAPVAGALAAGVRDRLGATYGLSLTGVAGPDRQNGVPVGTVFAGLTGQARPTVGRFTLSGGREEIRTGAVRVALDMLAAALR